MVLRYEKEHLAHNTSRRQRWFCPLTQRATYHSILHQNHTTQTQRLDIVCRVYLLVLCLALVFLAVIVVSSPRLTTVTQLFVCCTHLSEACLEPLTQTSEMYLNMLRFCLREQSFLTHEQSTSMNQHTVCYFSFLYRSRHWTLQIILEIMCVSHNLIILNTLI